jgi:uncharacterized protein
MKNLKHFNINFGSLSDGEHQFTYELDAKFLENFEASLLQDAKATAQVILHKQVGILRLEFDLVGTVPAICDVCAEEFELSVSAEETVLVKFVSEVPEADSTEIIYLEHGSSFLNVAQQLYEMLILSIPIRKVHPLDADKKPTCNPDTLAVLKSIRATKKKKKNDDDDDTPPSSSVWDVLKNLN